MIKNSNKDFLLDSYPDNTQIVESDRGGQITYHGPGQLIGYPIVNLNHFTKSVSWFMRSLEQIIIMTLHEYNISADRKKGMTGVWVDNEKICANTGLNSDTTPPTLSKCRLCSDKVIHDNSVWGFVAKKDGVLKGIPYFVGDVFKAASWRAPAKHVRGSIFNGTSDWYQWTGPNYLI